MDNNTIDEAYTTKWKDKIQALMLKAQDPACSEEERLAIMDKVNYLMVKYGIEEAMLNAQQGRTEKVISQGYILKGPHARQLMHMINQLAISFGCRAIYMNNDDKAIVYGHESDQERCFMLYGSLYIQLMTAKEAAFKNKPSRVHGRTFNDSFVKGFVHIVVTRLADAYKRAKSDVRSTSSGNGMELVLQNRDQRVNDAFRQAHPFTRRMTSDSRATNEAAYGAGRTAGQNADIGQNRVGAYVRNALGS